MSLPMAKKTLLILGICSVGHMLHGLSNYAKNDPYPVFTTLQPHHYLNTYHTDDLKGWKTYFIRERFALSLSPFGQNADTGKNIKNEQVPLGDLEGRWYMLGLLFGATPQGQTLPPVLATARAALFPTIPPGTPIDPQIIDPNEQFGYFSIPLTYRKRGLRVEFETMLCGDVGLQVQGGVADICQTVTAFNNLTPNNFTPPQTFPNLTTANVNTFIMNQRKNIEQQLGRDFGNFHQFSLEDIRLNLFWRHAYLINEYRESWPTFLLIPFVTVGFSGAVSKKRDYAFAFSVPFSNNDHNAFGAEGGLNFDFAETIEVGGHAGITYFFGKDISGFPVPTHECQSGIFPFTTDVSFHPGYNWHFGLKMNARHFLGKLSFYFQYVLINHQDDKITLKKPDPAFLPEILEARSTWKVQVANMAFNYDISPHISLGFLWQAPLSQRNAYRSSTVMFSFNAIW